MKIRQIVFLIIAITFLFSPADLTLAQGVQPPVEESGVLPSSVYSSQDEPKVRESADLVNTFPDTPKYDSGWVSLVQNEAKTLTHNLGGSIDNYVVDMQYWASGVDGINQRYYGGTDFGTNPAPGHALDDRVGAYWRSLTNTTITVYRRPQDTYAEKVRIRIWLDAAPNWDSHWVALALVTATTLNHNLGGNADDYIVDMQYRSSGNGVNQRCYNGMDFGSNPGPGHNPDDRVGTYWRSLTNTKITLYRRAEDDYSPEVRIRIWVRPTPTYDSGWILINPDEAIDLTHNIGGNTEDYIVDVQFHSFGSGTNQRHYGGADFGAKPPSGSSENDRVGAYWRSMTNSNIIIYRRPEDIYAEEMRVRIWDPSFLVYLPLVER